MRLDAGEFALPAHVDQVACGDRVVQVAQVDSRYLLGTRDWTEVDVPAHCSALGKVFLGWGVLAVPDTPQAAQTSATLTDPERLRLDVTRGRRRGWAVTSDELEVELIGVRLGAGRDQPSRVRVLRPGEDVDDRALLDDPATIKHHHPV